MKNIVLVTGCSHSAGGEQFDRHYIKNYEEFILNSQSKNHETIKKEIWSHQANLVINKKERFKKLLIKDQIKFGEIVKRYVRQMERKYSWPSYLQKELPLHKVINLSENAGSFKLAVKKTLQLYKLGVRPMIAIHQIPSINRTYFKSVKTYYNAISVDDFRMRSKVFKHQEYNRLLDYNLELYKNLVRRDVQNDYFVRIFKKHFNLLEKYSKIYKTISFYITEEPYDFIPKEKVIIDQFRKFRAQFKIGPDKHVIDKKFYPVLIKKIITATNLQKSQ